MNSILNKVDLKGVISVAFVILIALPTLVGFYTPDKKISHVEKRRLNVFPTWSDGITLASYFQGISDYLKDHFAYRQNLIRSHNSFKLAIGESPSNSIIMGKQGWLFYKTRDRLTSLTEEPNRVETNLKLRQQRVARLIQASRANGADYRFFIVPNKMSIYPELLPNRYQQTAQRKTVEYFMDLFPQETRGQVIDGVGILSPAKASDRKKIYYKYDAHWNFWGAYQAAKGLMTQLSEKRGLAHKLFVPEHAFTMQSIRGGDLANYIGLPKRLSNREPVTTFADCAKREQIKSIRPGLVKSECSQNQVKLLFIGDSFMAQIGPYLAESVGTLYRMHQGVPEHEVIRAIEEIKPDFVIDQIVERNLARPAVRRKMSQ